MKLEGFKTYIVAFVVALLPLISSSLGAVDWTALLTGWGVPSDMVVPAATAVSGVIMILMRFITQITTVQTALNTEPPK